jgi:hypothetical protein
MPEQPIVRSFDPDWPTLHERMWANPRLWHDNLPAEVKEYFDSIFEWSLKQDSDRLFSTNAMGEVYEAQGVFVLELDEDGKPVRGDTFPERDPKGRFLPKWWRNDDRSDQITAYDLCQIGMRVTFEEDEELRWNHYKQGYDVFPLLHPNESEPAGSQAMQPRDKPVLRFECYRITRGRRLHPSGKWWIPIVTNEWLMREVIPDEENPLADTQLLDQRLDDLEVENMLGKDIPVLEEIEFQFSYRAEPPPVRPVRKLRFRGRGGPTRFR